MRIARGFYHDKTIWSSVPLTVSRFCAVNEAEQRWHVLCLSHSQRYVVAPCLTLFHQALLSFEANCASDLGSRNRLCVHFGVLPLQVITESRWRQSHSSRSRSQRHWQAEVGASSNRRRGLGHAFQEAQTTYQIRNPRLWGLPLPCT